MFNVSMFYVSIQLQRHLFNVSSDLQVRGLCKQFKGEVYLTARDEARGKVKLDDLSLIFGFDPNDQEI